MDNNKCRTWEDVGVPASLVSVIKAMTGERLLEQLVSEKVFHGVRRVQYNYCCGVCGHQHKSEKSTDDYGQCEKCLSKAVFSTQCLRGWNQMYYSGCSKSDEYAREVVSKMRFNYATYYEVKVASADDFLTIRCRDRGFAASFTGGEFAEEPTTAKAICKASLLVPYLWDGRYDWKSNKIKSVGRRSSIIPTLFEWTQRRD